MLKCYEIANTLQIPRPTITKDVQYLRPHIQLLSNSSWNII